jgi:hypothetical protein
MKQNISVFKILCFQKFEVKFFDVGHKSILVFRILFSDSPINNRVFDGINILRTDEL